MTEHPLLATNCRPAAELHMDTWTDTDREKKTKEDGDTIFHSDLSCLCLWKCSIMASFKVTDQFWQSDHYKVIIASLKVISFDKCVFGCAKFQYVRSLAKVKQNKNKFQILQKGQIPREGSQGTPEEPSGGKKPGGCRRHQGKDMHKLLKRWKIQSFKTKTLLPQGSILWYNRSTAVSWSDNETHTLHTEDSQAAEKGCLPITTLRNWSARGCTVPVLEHKTFALAINRDYFSTVFTSDHRCTI